MSDFDLERLGDVWRQQPDREELERLRRTAEAVQRRARWAHWTDIAAAVLVAGVVIFLVASNPETDTLLVGGAAILVLLIGQVRQRRLRAEELQSLTGTAEQMLDQSISRVRATIKRTRFSLYTLPPAFLFGTLIAHVVSGGRDLLPQSTAGPLFGLAAIVVVVLVSIHFVRTSRRCGTELERLEALRRSYRQENESENAE